MQYVALIFVVNSRRFTRICDNFPGFIREKLQNETTSRCSSEAFEVRKSHATVSFTICSIYELYLRTSLLTVLRCHQHLRNQENLGETAEFRLNLRISALKNR